jgi:flavodoxin
MKAVILYDSKSAGGSTEAIVDAIGLGLVDAGVSVEKAKCKASADYSFVKEFDIVILGAPVYYFVVASQLLGSMIHGDLKKNLNRKKIALFLTCGSSESIGAVLYMPQLKMHLIRNKILAEKIFAPDALSNGTIDLFVEDVMRQYKKTLPSRRRSSIWSDEALAHLQSAPAFIQGKFRTLAEEYAEERGYKEITLEMLEEARSEFEGG